MSEKNSMTSTNHCARTYFWELTLVHLTVGSCTSPTDTSPFTYHPFNGPGMCAVYNFQRLIFVNSQSPDKFTRKPKIVSLPTISQESLKHKSTFTLTFKLRKIYKVNGTTQYIERCWPATNIYGSFQHCYSTRRTSFWIWRSKIDRNKSVPNKW